MKKVMIKILLQRKLSRLINFMRFFHHVELVPINPKLNAVMVGWAESDFI